MPDLLAPADTSDPARAREGQDPGQDPGQRGTLAIDDNVVERIAAIAAGEVEGVVKAGSSLDQVLGHHYPKVSTTIAGHRARIHVEIAVAWPHPLGQVCGRVRDEVRDRVTQLAGIQVDAVDVLAAKVVHAPEPEQRRVQ